MKLLVLADAFWHLASGYWALMAASVAPTYCVHTHFDKSSPRSCSTKRPHNQTPQR